MKEAMTEKDSLKKQEYIHTAIKTLHEGLKIHPKFGEIYSILGLIYQQFIPNTDSALKYYHKAIETAPNYALSYFNLGNLYYQLGKYNIASYLYNEAFRINPEYLQAKQASEKLKNSLGFDVHINPFTSAVDTNVQAKNTRYYYNLGNYYASQGNYQKAIESFKESIRLDNNNIDPYINLANCYGILKDYEKSIAVSKEALAKYPNHIKILQNLAVTYKLMGDEKKSEECLKLAEKFSKK
jgi:tetratricopeptide (TPR) repeat protein